LETTFTFLSVYMEQYLRVSTRDSMVSRAFFTRMTKESGIKSSQSPI